MLRARTDFRCSSIAGSFRGRRNGASATGATLPIPAKEIDAVILTHAHLDHCGWIPRLVKEGFRGPIYATPPTIDSVRIILPDSGHLQEEDARFYNKIKKSKHDPALPLYTFEEAQNSLQYFKPVRVGRRCSQLSPELSFRFVRAAHILGSCMAEVSLNANGHDAAIAFHGRHWARARSQSRAGKGRALGSGRKARLPTCVVMESTYGNRTHPKEDPMPELAGLITGHGRARRQRGGSGICD